jgi:hypothetical protein
MNPRTEAAAFIIWAFCNPIGWNCSVDEISDETGLTPQMIGAVLKVKGWRHRLRVSKRLGASQTGLDGYAYVNDVDVNEVVRG